MAKNILITEKPSVAMEFAKVLNINTSRKDGYLEADNWIITWCVGHLVTMSYPEKYDEKLKFWRLDTLPFIPEEYKYEVIPSVQKQFNTIQSLLTREDVSTIYVATDSGREGEYIYRLVEQMIGVKNKDRKRVWIDSQTEEEIKRGIREAKELDEYDSLADSAYLRAKEDYLIGINFSRLLTIIYGRRAAKELDQDKISISVGRVMTCVLGMVVSREREIRNFVKVPYYKIVGEFVNNVKEQALGEEVKKSLKPGEMFASIIRNELINLLGGDKSPLVTDKNPTIVLMCGLQGSGKTTTVGKLGALVRKKYKKNPLFIACDVYRPAAIDQLKTVGKSLNIPVYDEGKGNPVEIAKNGIEYAKENGYNYILIDTAGRLQIDETLMDELKNIYKETNPNEV